MSIADCCSLKDQFASEDQELVIFSAMVEKADVVPDSDAQARLGFVQRIEDADDIAQPKLRSIILTAPHSHLAWHKYKGLWVKPLEEGLCPLRNEPPAKTELDVTWRLADRFIEHVPAG